MCVKVEEWQKCHVVQRKHAEAAAVVEKFEKIKEPLFEFNGRTCVGTPGSSSCFRRFFPSPCFRQSINFFGLFIVQLLKRIELLQLMFIFSQKFKNIKTLNPLNLAIIGNKS